MRRFTLLAAGVAACAASSATGPGAPLEAHVAVSPTAAAPGDSVTVAVRVDNPGPGPVHVRFLNTCILTYEVRDGSGATVAPGIGCGQAITDYTFAVGTIADTFGFVVGDFGFDLPAGTYQVVGGAGHPLRIESPAASLTITDH